MNNKFINPEWVVSFVWVQQARVMQPRWGWKLFWRMTQGSPTLRANPGLKDGIPLGFKLSKSRMKNQFLRSREIAILTEANHSHAMNFTGIRFVKKRMKKLIVRFAGIFTISRSPTTF
jgi:hypothetical protein